MIFNCFGHFLQHVKANNEVLRKSKCLTIMSRVIGESANNLCLYVIIISFIYKNTEE